LGDVEFLDLIRNLISSNDVIRLSVIVLAADLDGDIGDKYVFTRDVCLNDSICADRCFSILSEADVDEVEELRGIDVGVVI
jgi:hypothetical protein